MQPLKARVGVVIVGVLAALVIFSSSVLTQDDRATADIEIVEFEQGTGARHDFWQVYFNAPTGSRDRSTYSGGIDAALAAAIDGVRYTLDIAAFELNNAVITEAIRAAHERGVQVRLVVDDEHGVEDDDTTLLELQLAGIPIVDDQRTGLMHNKFMIMDSETVWLGSMNYTVNGVYRNNNNVVAITAPLLVRVYLMEFEEMFTYGRFGITSPADNTIAFEHNGVEIEAYFASENAVADQIIEAINAAEERVRFMAFSFTRDDIGQALVAQHEAGIQVEGIFERVGTGTEWSEMARLFCNGIDARRDFNAFILHHKVFIIDDETVLTGSFNFSNNATRANDENMVIIKDPLFAAQFIAEYERMYANSGEPDYIDCATHPAVAGTTD